MREIKMILVFLIIYIFFSALSSNEEPTDLIIVLHDNSEENEKAFFNSFSKYELRKIHQNNNAVTELIEMLCIYNIELVKEEEILSLLREDKRVRYVVRNFKLSPRSDENSTFDRIINMLR